MFVLFCSMLLRRGRCCPHQPLLVSSSIKTRERKGKDCDKYFTRRVYTMLKDNWLRVIWLDKKSRIEYWFFLKWYYFYFLINRKVNLPGLACKLKFKNNFNIFFILWLIKFTNFPKHWRKLENALHVFSIFTCLHWQSTAREAFQPNDRQHSRQLPNSTRCSINLHQLVTWI